MLRIQCTAEDLLRVSIAEHPAPLAELAAAVAMFQRRDANPVFTPWRQRLARTLPGHARPLLQLLSPLGAGPGFLDPPVHTVAEGIARVLSTPRADVRAELQRMCTIDRPLTPWVRDLADQDREAWRILEQALRAAYQAILAEQWPRLRATFYAETAWRARILAQHGLHTVLTGLSPSIHWHGMTLAADFPRDIHLVSSGRGIILQPSLLWADHPLVGRHPDGRLILIYPATTPLPLLEPGVAGDALVTLLGGTRAHALRLLTRQHTTSQLARELDVTVAAASMQARTLRDAGLITSRREGKAVWHWCTRIGLDLLTATLSGGTGAPPRAPGRGRSSTC